MNRKRVRRTKPKEKRVTVEDLQNNTTKVLDYVLFDREVLVTKNDSIVAKITQYSDNKYLRDIEKQLKKVDLKERN